MWSGTQSQKAAIEAIEALSILSELKEFDPLFAGTIPIGVDLEGADIDIICCVSDFSRFVERVKDCFSTHKNFLITESYNQAKRSIVARFDYQKFRLEIFAQNVPTQEQNAFRHMLAEARLLNIFGEELRTEVRLLKARGIKTEPAFAKVLGIDGDPYTELLKFVDMPKEEILKTYKVKKTPEIVR